MICVLEKKVVQLELWGQPAQYRGHSQFLTAAHTLTWEHQSGYRETGAGGGGGMYLSCLHTRDGEPGLPGCGSAQASLKPV